MVEIPEESGEPMYNDDQPYLKKSCWHLVGKKIVLASRQKGTTPIPIIYCTNQPSTCVQVYEEIECEFVIYALLPCENIVADIEPYVPLEVHQLLLEFFNLVLEDLPFKLPLMRNIKHHIYFVLGSSSLYRPLYNLNLKESKELQCHILELLEKGYIHQSMSPYVVFTLLVSKNDSSWRM